MIKLYVLAFVALSIFLGYMAYKMGKNKKEKESPKKPTTKSRLDDKIEAIKAEIEALENSLPEEITANSARIEELKTQLEDIKKLKLKFN